MPLPRLLRTVLRRRRAIATLAIGPQSEALWEFARPGFEDYARRLGADLHVFRTNPFADRGAFPTFGKLQLGALLERYDRVLYLDNDMIVSPDAPDLFAAVPARSLGVYLEGAVIDRSDDFARIEALRGRIPGWTTARYFNAGLMVLSQAHRGLFAEPDSFEMGTVFTDQTYFNWKAQALGLPLHGLDRRWNAMYPYVDSPRGNWITHYAGYGFTPPLDWRDGPPGFPFKYHQMQAHAEHLRGRDVTYFHPEQLVLERGRLVRTPLGLNRLHCPPTSTGVVAYGPFRPVAGGRYAVALEHSLDAPAAGPLFRFDLASESGARIWHHAEVAADTGQVAFEVDLPPIEQLEVRIWAAGAPVGFSIERLRLERLGPSRPHADTATAPASGVASRAGDRR